MKGKRKTNRRRVKFVLCIWNEGEDDLQMRKVYEVIPDALADAHNTIRVIDESGEDYIYPATYFVPLELPKAVEEALETAQEVQ